MRIKCFLLSVFIAFPLVSNGAVISYQDDGDFQTSSYIEGGLEVTGSGIINVRNWSPLVIGGLSIVGGNDSFVDSGEFLEFSTGATTLLRSFEIGSRRLGNLAGPSFDGYSIEGFDALDLSVGTFNYEGSGIVFSDDDFVARLGGTSLQRIRISATTDSFRIATVFVDIVPEPSTAILLLGGCVTFLQRRR